MSTLTRVEKKKAATPALTSRLSATPQRHFELPRQANPTTEARTFDTTPAEPGFGYGFSRIPVQAPSSAIGDGTTQRATQSCPLAASPRACPLAGPAIPVPLRCRPNSLSASQMTFTSRRPTGSPIRLSGCRILPLTGLNPTWRQLLFKLNDPCNGQRWMLLRPMVIWRAS